MEFECEPTLQNILDQKSLRWIFCGGKGGVGKTTVSCSLAIQLAKVRKSVLLISTDPAHNLSDAFNQQFNKDATLVKGFENLYAMEIDPSKKIDELIKSLKDDSNSNSNSITNRNPQFDTSGIESVFQETISNLPGVDEAISFAEVMKQVKATQFDVIVFDTAPTGHTLRFMNFPEVLTKALEKLKELLGSVGGIMDQMSAMMGGPAAQSQAMEMQRKIENLRNMVAEVKDQFSNPDLTTFVCVCIAEFLSLYETERMIQELTSFHIDTHNIVFNQLLKDSTDCKFCDSRRAIQKKYFEQACDLYDTFHLVQLPQRPYEVRGAEKLAEFSDLLIHPEGKSLLEL